MHDEFLALTKTLNVPLHSEDDIIALSRLQKQWEHWANRERQHAPSRVATEQQAAFEGDGLEAALGVAADDGDGGPGRGEAAGDFIFEIKEMGHGVFWVG